MSNEQGPDFQSKVVVIPGSPIDGGNVDKPLFAVGERVLLKDGKTVEIKGARVDRSYRVVDSEGKEKWVLEKDLKEGVLQENKEGRFLATVWDRGFSQNERVYFMDENGKKKIGTLTYEAFDEDGNSLVGITIQLVAFDQRGNPQTFTDILTVPLEEFLELNPPDKREAVKDLGESVLNLLDSK